VLAVALVVVAALVAIYWGVAATTGGADGWALRGSIMP
jgi:hypothetical protein